MLFTYWLYFLECFLVSCPSKVGWINENNYATCLWRMFSCEKRRWSPSELSFFVRVNESWNKNLQNLMTSPWISFTCARWTVHFRKLTSQNGIPFRIISENSQFTLNNVFCMFPSENSFQRRISRGVFSAFTIFF